MINLDYTDHRPLYEQIKEKMKFLIIRGILNPDEKIPSVRELAQSLAINPNTIQKAYKDLETEGFIYSIRGKGNFVAPLGCSINAERQGKLLVELDNIVSELMFLNVPKEQIISCITEVYKTKGEDHND